MTLTVTRLVDRFFGRTTRHKATGRTRTQLYLEWLEGRHLLSTGLHFDFGQPTSPVAPGYVGVSADSYSPAKGYGWQNTNGLYSDDRWVPNADPMKEDFVYGGDQTFMVNLPDGAYVVQPTLGDYYVARTGVSLWLQGQQVASGLSSAAGEFLQPNFDVQVTNGLLTFRVADAGGYYSLNGLDINPAATALTASAGSDQVSSEGSAVTFAGSASGGTAPYTYAWNFGDGTTAQGTANPSHTYTNQGTYTAALTVNDTAGSTALSTAQVTVNDVPPTTSAGGPYGGVVGTAVTFAASATSPSPAETAAGFTFTWAFGDGTTGTGTSPAHTYAAAGIYTATVTATAADGATSAPATAAVSVAAHATALHFDFGQPTSPVAPGYIGVSADSYSPAKGYGWQNTNGLYSDDRWVPNADPMKEDFVYGGDQTFMVNLPDGAYVVQPTLGDYYVARTGVSLWLQGQQVASGLSSAAGQFVQPTFDVQVTNGLLTFRVADAGGYYSLNGLDITPAVASGPVVNIDAAWLQQHGTAPYALDQAATRYVLDTNVQADGTAFVVTAAGVTLDLNGHTITYNNAAGPVITNPDFEIDPIGATTVTGWDTSGAAAATPTIAANTDYLFGNQVLQLSNFTSASGPQSITSDPIAIPVANHSYAASVAMSAPGGTQNSPIASVVISVYRVSDNALLATGSTGGGWNADGSLATFTPTDTSPVRLVITVTALTTSPTTIDLDHVRLTQSFDYGVVASNEWDFNGYLNLPTALQNSYVHASSATITDSVGTGAIVQGAGNGYGCDAIMAQTLLTPLVVTGVTLIVGGDNCSAIDAGIDGVATTLATRLITNNTIVYRPGSDVINRMNSSALINCGRSTGDVTIAGNSLTGVPQTGIVITSDDPTRQNLIENNTLIGDVVASNGYMIAVANASNVQILDNTITTSGPGESGQGIDLDELGNSNATNIEVAGNNVSVQSDPYREYGTSIPARALRIRNDAGDSSTGSFVGLSVHDNTFVAYTDAGLASQAYAGWVTLHNNPGASAPNSNIVFANNLFEAIDRTSDPGYVAEGLVIDGIDPGIFPEFTGNTIESNDIALAVGGYDGGNVSDVVLTSNTLSKSSAGAVLPFTGIQVGYWIYQIHDVQIYDTQLQNGATANIAWTGQGTKDVEVGWLLTVVAQDSTGAALAGANVSVTDNTGALVFAGPTGAGGQVVIPVITTVYSQIGTDPTAINATGTGPLTVSITSGQTTQNETVTLIGDSSLDFTF